MGKYFYENVVINQLVVRGHKEHVIKVTVYLGKGSI